MIVSFVSSCKTRTWEEGDLTTNGKDPFSIINIRSDSKTIELTEAAKPQFISQYLGKFIGAGDVKGQLRNETIIY